MDNQKITFMETLRAVAEVAKTSEHPLSKEQIDSYFQDIELNQQQRELIYQYMQNPQEEEPQETEDNQEPEGETAQEERNADSVMEDDMEIKSTTQAEQENKIPESVFFQMYLEELEQVKIMTEAEKAKLYEKLVAGDDTVVKTLSEQWLKEILELAKKYTPSADYLEDLVQEGNMAAFLALGQLCKNTGITDYQEFVTEQIVQSMKAYLSDSTGEKELEQTMMAKASLVHEAQSYLAQENGHVPTMEELSAYTQIPQEELTDVLAMAKELPKK